MKKEHKVASTIAGEERVINDYLRDGWLVKKMKIEKKSGKVVYLLEKKYNG